MVNTRRTDLSNRVRNDRSGRAGSSNNAERRSGSGRRYGGRERPEVSNSVREMIAEEVRRALRDTLPELLGPQVEGVQKQRHDATLEVQSEMGTHRPVRGARQGCTFKEFMNCKPTEFKGTTNPVEALTWVSHIEKMFRTSKCGEEDMVEYATNLLRGRAQHWWDVLCNTLGTDVVRVMTWENFKVRFNEEYCSQVAVRQLEESFMKLRQGVNSVLDYTGEFNEKARFVEHQVTPESRKIERYLYGLNTEIREFVKAAKLTTFRDVVDAAMEREGELKRQRVDRDESKEYQSSKKKREEPKEVDDKKRGSERESSRWGDRRVEKEMEGKWCDKCRKRHVGECDMKDVVDRCYRCGKSGHRIRDCPEARPVCYNCGSVEHMRRDCPKLKERNESIRGEKKGVREDVRKQAYQMTVAEMMDRREEDTGMSRNDNLWLCVNVQVIENFGDEIS